MLLSLGLTGEALDIFEKLEMWEDAIACYQRMGKIEKVQTVFVLVPFFLHLNFKKYNHHF